MRMERSDQLWVARACRTACVAVAVLCVASASAARVARPPDGAAQGILARIGAEPLRLHGSAPGVLTQRDPSPDAASFSLLSLPVWTHQTLISPQDGDRCVFEPSCSAYAARALRSRGLAGWPMAADRILRCHDGAHGKYPFAAGHSLDPVPAPGAPSLSLAGGMASLVPGLGQWLAGDHGDAVYALGSVALLAWGAAHYARRDEPFAAAPLGGLGVFFYVGSVYGGARAIAGRAAH